LTFEKIYTEQELVCLLKQKDKNAFGYLYDKYAASFYGMILTNLNHNEKVAQGILQDVFVRIWKSFEAYDNTKEVLFTWMFRIVSSSIKDNIGIIKKFSIQSSNKNVSVVTQ
jgi:RNA polymerase sigma-70 factor (ECF subfamily)